MCGIVGFVNTKGVCDKSELISQAQRMSESLSHRGPDDSGEWVDTEHGLALAHRRLAIIDLSKHGHQPMISASGRYVIVYNGELYNYRELGKNLSKTGSSLQGHSDTEVLLQMIELFGVEQALEKCNGMFAFAVWDKKHTNLTLVRDRFGEKPLYYGVNNGNFLFSSELKALTQHKKWNGIVSQKATYEYIRRGYVPSTLSIFEGIHKLAPGSMVRIHIPKLNHREDALNNARNAEPVQYWSLNSDENEDQSLMDEVSVVELLEKKLKKAVGMRMTADVPIGALLSGGVDSSLIVALAQSQSIDGVHTFTVGFGEDEFNEARVSKEIAGLLGTRHTEYYLSPNEALQVISRLPEIYDEPFSDSSQIPTYLISTIAKRDVSVVLSGDGADEVFGGYTRYLLYRDLWQRVGKFPNISRSMLAVFLRYMPVDLMLMMGSKIKNHINGDIKIAFTADKVERFCNLLGAVNSEDFYARMVSVVPDPGKILKQEKSSMNVENWWQMQATNKNVVEQAMWQDIHDYLPDDILTKVDRASMATSLETRVPYLDHELVQFAQKLPLKYKVRGGTTKWILREILSRYIPREIIDRPKKGFAVPIGAWLRHELRDWAEDLLSENALQDTGVFHVNEVRKRWLQHQTTKYNWQHQIWAVLMFQAWHMRYMKAC